MNEKNRNKILQLQTIKDFDFAVGGPEDHYIRVSQTPAVTDSEVNLIIWLLLEKEFHSKKDSPDFADGDGDQIDAKSSSRRRETDFGGAVSRRRTEADGGHRCTNQIGYGHGRLNQSKKYAEDLLRAVDVEIPFQLLSEQERSRLFILFSSSSNLLLQERYSSILSFYQALRRRSKFRENFEKIKVLGEGSFGEVFAVKSLTSQAKFAVKRIPLTFDALDDIRAILNESMILKKLSGHSNVAHYFDSWLAMDSDDEDEDALIFFLQMELCDSSLANWKSDFPNEKLDEKLLITISGQLADALEWIHSNGFLHLDINPKNILWANSSRNSVKIVDFGLAVIGSSFSGRSGTVPYCAPESTLTAKSDVYSLGVTLFEVSQNFSTGSELYHRLSAKNFTTGIQILDDILPKMLSKHSHRPTASELKVKLNVQI